MAAHKDDKWYPFWENMKEGYDYFETTRLPPKVTVCEKRYIVNAAFTSGARINPAGSCPAYRKLPVVAYKPLPAPAKVMQASLVKPKSYGSVLGLKFGPQKPAYTAFTLGPALPEVVAKK